VNQGRKLARHVTVAGTTYGPGDKLTDEVIAQIKNPKAWVPIDADSYLDDVPSDVEPGTESGHRLARSVTVGTRTYTPSDFLPDDVARQISNPKAWEGGKVPTFKAKATDAPPPDPDPGPVIPSDPDPVTQKTPAKPAPAKSTGSKSGA
jgi:hypothetical protein